MLRAQRRALCRHLNFQKWSKREVFCTFLLRNVLRATMACTFSTSQLPNMWRFVHFDLEICFVTMACNFSSLIWPAGSAPAALASLLFDLRGHKSLEKHSVSRLSYLSRTCIFFLLTLSLLLFFCAFHLSILSEV